MKTFTLVVELTVNVPEETCPADPQNLCVEVDPDAFKVVAFEKGCTNPVIGARVLEHTTAAVMGANGEELS